MNPRVILVPSRMASTRFPGKPLAMLLGKPMIQWVWERCCCNRAGARVVVVSEDREIRDVIRKLGGEVFTSSSGHRNGSTRIHEAAVQLKARYIVNVQGDEPFVDPWLIDRLFEVLEGGVAVCTAHYAVCDEQSYHSPNQVKLVCTGSGRCLYFSRSPIPHTQAGTYKGHLVHQGIYGYQNWALNAYVTHGPSVLEQEENLEQLRFMEMGIPIVSVPCRMPAVGVDVPGDIERAEAHIQSMQAEGKT